MPAESFWDHVLRVRVESWRRAKAVAFFPDFLSLFLARFSPSNCCSSFFLHWWLKTPSYLAQFQLDFLQFCRICRLGLGFLWRLAVAFECSRGSLVLQLCCAAHFHTHELLSANFCSNPQLSLVQFAPWISLFMHLAHFCKGSKDILSVGLHLKNCNQNAM